MGATSGARAAYLSGATIVLVGLVLLISLVFCVVFLYHCLSLRAFLLAIILSVPSN
jgi:hypothetical protein